MNSPFVFGRVAVLLSDIPGAVCWNYDDGRLHTVRTGMRVNLVQAEDPNRTVVCVVDEANVPIGIEIPHAVGPSGLGFRFIVDNAALAASLPAAIPAAA